jgi:quercetin dioxygenase-like cupin family protein
VTWPRGAEQVLRPGGALFIPRGTPHAFIVTPESARILIAFTPASEVTEDFFRNERLRAFAELCRPE